MEPATRPPYHLPVFGGGSITLFHIRGIRIAVDWSWFLILFLVIFWMSNFYSDLLGDSGGSTTPFLLGLASAAGFFGSILLHELGPAVAAPPRRGGPRLLLRPPPPPRPRPPRPPPP